MDTRQFLHILRARHRTFFGTLIGFVALVLCASLLWPKSYTAMTAIVLEQKPDPINGIMNSGGLFQSSSYVLTQVDVIQSERVAAKVVRALRLHEDPDVMRDWHDDTQGRGDIVIWLARLLLKELNVRPHRDSSVIDILFTGRDPKFAAEIANQFAEAYVQTSLELKVEPARQYAAWFIARTGELRKELESAQSVLSKSQRDKGIVSIDERLDVENTRLVDLSRELVAVQARMAEVQSREAQASGDKNILPEVVQSTLVQTLKADVVRAEARLEQLGGQIGKNHPQYRRSAAELEAMRARLVQETNRVASSIGTVNRATVQTEAEIREALLAQKRKVLQLKRERDELAVMQRDVESAEKAYDLVARRFTQTNMEGQLSQTSVAVLYPAAEPVQPSRPRLVLNLVLAVVFGVPLGIGTVMRREMTDYRIRLADDVSRLLKLPLLGVIEQIEFAGDGRERGSWLTRWRGRATGRA